MSKFDWNHVSDNEVSSIDKYAALYHYCNDYHRGIFDWRYSLLSKSPYSPGPMERSILDLIDSYPVTEYYGHLVSLFEAYKGIGNHLITGGDPQYLQCFWDIVVPDVTGTFESLSDLTNEVYNEICGLVLDHYPSILDVYHELSVISLTEFPLVIEETDEIGDEVWGLTFAFDFVEDIDEAEGDIF